MIRTTSTLTLCLAAGLALNLGCDRNEAGHGHGTAAGHAHEASERPSFAPTVYAEVVAGLGPDTTWGLKGGHREHGEQAVPPSAKDSLQLYVEYAAFVKGEESKFGVHLTRLDGYQAVNEGTVEAILTGAGGEQRFTGTLSPTPGIFRLAPRPSAAGEVQVRLIWKGPKGQATFDLGKHTVYPDLASSMKAEVPEVSGGIAFLKEQQWNVPFGITRAQQRPLSDGFEAYASVLAVPGGEGRVLAPVAGRLEGSGFPGIGQMVKRGQRLGGLVPKAGSDLSLGSVQLDFERSKLRLDQAKANHTRLKGLLEQEAVPRRRVEEAAREEALTEAEFKVAQARKDEVTTGKGGMALALTAPVSGIVSTVNGGPGVQVAEGQELFHIVDTRRLRLEVQVPEAQSGRLAKVASVWFQAPGQPPMVLESGKTARVLGHGGAVHPERRTVPFVMEFGNPSGTLKVGASGKAFVRTGTAGQALAVPASALQDEDGLAVVYVQAGGERFERRIVRVGARDGDWVQILSGVQKDEWVVTTGAHLVRLAASSGKVPEHGHAH